MKIFLKYAFLFLSIFILLSCDKEFTSRDYPRLNTLEVTWIDGERIIFSAEIIFRGSSEILNYGFVWSESMQPDISHSEKVVFDGNTAASGFSAEITSIFSKGTTYYVRSFVQTSGYTVYGNGIGFKVAN
jgi:hypothetical protein